MRFGGCRLWLRKPTGSRGSEELPRGVKGRAGEKGFFLPGAAQGLPENTWRVSLLGLVIPLLDEADHASQILQMVSEGLGGNDTRQDFPAAWELSIYFLSKGSWP